MAGRSPASVASVTSALPIFVLIIVTMLPSLEATTRTAQSDKREFCQFDSFEARCDENEAIIMESAHYGRMRSGRCISGEGYIGCSADVRTFMDGHCSGRRHCVVTVASLTSIVQPCRRDFTSYLEATYTCKKVATEANRCGRDKAVVLTAETGLIFGAAMLIGDSAAAAATSGTGRTIHGGPVEESDNRHQLAGHRCSWQVRAAGGQRVVFRLSVYRPAGRLEVGTNSIGADLAQQHQSTSGGGGGVDTGSCPWMLIVDDGETSPIRESLCWRGSESHGFHTAHRAALNGQVECRPKDGLACSIHLDWPDSHILVDEELPIFVLHYEVIGCPDVDPGNGAVVERRVGDELVIHCLESREKWYMTCGPDNRWIGEMSNCTTRVVAGPHKAPGSTISFPHGLIAAIVLGLIFGLIIGTASLGGLYVYRRRKSSPTPRHTAATDLDDGIISDEYGSEKLRLEPPLSATTGHLDHSHHMHHLHLRTGPPTMPTSADCWRMQTFDYSRVAGDNPHAPTTFDLISSSSAPGSIGIQPIYCPSSGRYGTSRLGPSSVHASTLSGGSTVIDYMCAGAGDTPVVTPRCGRPHCAAAAAAAAASSGTSSIHMAYETPRFVQSLDLPAVTSTSSAVPPSVAPRVTADSKVYHEMHDASKQQRRPAVTFATNPI